MISLVKFNVAGLGFRLPGAGTVASAFLIAFFLTAILVMGTIFLCQKYGWVARPRADRWHRSTPACYGGVPIWVGFIAASSIFLPGGDHLVWKLVAISSLMFGLGFVDDVFHLRPGPKFLVQLVAAVLVMDCGVIYPLRQNLTVNIVISVVWLVGITNAFNLLDNMDGLSAGVALITALYLAMFYLGEGSPDYASLMALVAGATAAFLVFNFNPARIFMGDGGSLFIGFMLGSVSLLRVTHISGVPVLVFIPAAVLAIPIFDTFFVSVTRRLRGQPVSQGGTDHSSHRLVQLGLNERSAVLLLYALTAASGGIALAMRHLLYPYAVGLIAFWFFFLLLFGIHLFRNGAAVDSHVISIQPSFLRRLLEQDTLAFLLDPVVLSLSYYLAYCVRFHSAFPDPDLTMFLRSWLIVLACKFFSLWLCKVYQRSWWRGSFGDAYRLAHATLLGEAFSVLLIIGLYRFNGYSRAVFVIDGLVSWALLLVIRKSFLLFQHSMLSLRSPTQAERRVFVLGTSERAEVALRFLQCQRIQCAGLIDVNGGGDLGRCVWGAPVLGRLDDLARLASHHGISEIILPESEPLSYPEPEFREFCRRERLRLTKLGLYAPSGRAEGTSAGRA